VLQVRTRERDPSGWAAAQSSLGTTLTGLGEHDDQVLRAAIAAYRLALEVWTPAAHPVASKRTSDYLARAQALLATHGG
jgi:hypothetical protein